MKLLLKVLTPRMFARKFPDFWARDYRGGSVEVESIDDNRLVIILKGVDDLDHMGAIAAGFIGTTFEAIGVLGLQVLRPNWSLAGRSPGDGAPCARGSRGLGEDIGRADRSCARGRAEIASDGAAGDSDAKDLT